MVVGSGATVGPAVPESCESPANTRGFALNWTTLPLDPPLCFAPVMGVEWAATPDVAVASSSRIGVRPMCGCAGR